MWYERKEISMRDDVAPPNKASAVPQASNTTGRGRRHPDTGGGSGYGIGADGRKRTRPADRCDACEKTVARLYVIPPHRRLSERAPRTACFFCYLRAVGASPRRQQLVSQRQDGPHEHSG